MTRKFIQAVVSRASENRRTFGNIADLHSVCFLICVGDMKQELAIGGEMQKANIGESIKKHFPLSFSSNNMHMVYSYLRSTMCAFVHKEPERAFKRGKGCLFLI